MRRSKADREAVQRRVVLQLFQQRQHGYKEVYSVKERMIVHETVLDNVLMIQLFSDVECVCLFIYIITARSTTASSPRRSRIQPDTLLDNRHAPSPGLDMHSGRRTTDGGLVSAEC